MKVQGLLKCLYIFYVSRLINAQDELSCALPNNGGHSTCIRLHHCEPLMSILRQRAGKPSASEAEFIRGHACGNKFVCCPFNSISNAEQRILLNEIANHTNLNLINKRCGKNQDNQPKIMGGGGVEASISEYPWMALLKYKKPLEDTYTYNCGGSLISNFYVLTAAHCLTKNLFAVRLGEHRISTTLDCDDSHCSDPVQDIPIQAAQKHEQYDKHKKLHDIALLRLQSEAVFGSSVRTICLPTNSRHQLDAIEPYSRMRMMMTGWGRTEHVKSSDVLIEVTLPLVSNVVCAQTYLLLGIDIHESHICAGGRNQADACFGDSGGPLQTVVLVEEKPRMMQYGIVAAGFNCEFLDENHPGIYTNVAFYLKWILDHMSVT